MKMTKFDILIFLTTILLTTLPNISCKEEGEEMQLFICNKYTCPKGRGTCNENNECVCLKGYDTIDDTSKGDFYCNYKRKSKVIAFILEFVLGFGSGHFYLGHKEVGIIKMILMELTCLIFCQYHSIRKITELKRFARPVEIILLAIWLVWQVADGLLIMFGTYKDSEGYDLKGW